MQTWRSPERQDPYRPLYGQVYIDGREVDRRGHMESNCRWTLFIRRLAVEVTNCGRRPSPLRLRYVGTVRFTFIYWQGERE